jgi:heptaprenyl diphosphate synthase
MSLHGKYSRRILALLGACCFFLSAIEYMIPKPLPFMRIGLTNMPLMIAIDLFSFPAFLVLICIKVIGQAIITGTLFSYIFLFSIAGTFCSGIIMYAMRRAIGKKRISFMGIGAAGATISNIAQLILAYKLIFKENVLYIAPAFLAAGLVAGIVLGFFCEVFVRKSEWYNKMKEPVYELA